jgi:hypothetical protein
MSFTRADSKRVFNHLLDEVLGMDDSSPLKKSLVAANYKDLFSLLAIERDTIDGLIYDRSDEEINVRVTAGDRSILLALLSYIIQLQNRGTLTEASDWLLIQQADFDLY